MDKKYRDETNILIGLRLKYYRRLKGFSQALLAEKLDISFQQVQKYEKGVNRISASTLYEISRILKVRIEDFFVDLEPLTENSLITDCPNLLKIHSVWNNIRDKELKVNISNMVCSVSKANQG